MYTRLCYVHLYVLSSIFSLDRTTISCACHSNSSIHHSDNATTHRRRLFPLSALTVLFRTLPLSLPIFVALTPLLLLRWRCQSPLASASASASTVTFRFCVQLFISCLYFFSAARGILFQFFASLLSILFLLFFAKLATPARTAKQASERERTRERANSFHLPIYLTLLNVCVCVCVFLSSMATHKSALSLAY